MRGIIKDRNMNSIYSLYYHLGKKPSTQTSVQERVRGRELQFGEMKKVMVALMVQQRECT